MADIHATAIVSPGAELAEGVTVGPYSIIGENVKIGARTKVGPHVVIEGHTTIGEENQIFQFASIGSAPQDLKYKGEPSTLIIGNRNIIREYVTLQPGTVTGKMTTKIGNHNLFMATSHVAHDCVVGDRNIFANGVALAGHVEICNGVILGGMAAVHQFARVGDLAFLGANAMCSLDVPPFAMMHGDHAKIRGLNLIGMRRAGFTAEDVQAVKRAYKVLFMKGGKIGEKIESLPADLKSHPRVGIILEFLSKTSRGVVSWARGTTELEE